MLNKLERWFHPSCVKFPLVRMSASWFLVSMYLIWILGSKLIRSKNQSRATLWVLETCLIVGLLPFMIILIIASLSSNTYNKASWWKDLTFEGIKSTLSKSLITLWDACVFELCEVVNELHVCSTTGRPVLDDSDSQPQSCIQRNDFSFRWTVRNWSLFLTHPTYRNKCMTSKNTRCSTRSRFWILKISCKIGVLKQSQSALFGSVSHMAILFVFTCMMNAGDQTR